MALWLCPGIPLGAAPHGFVLGESEPKTPFWPKISWFGSLRGIRDKGMESEAFPSRASPAPPNTQGGDVGSENPNPLESHLETF